MRKSVLITILIVLGLVSYPLGLELFPWALSLSAIEMSDGTKAVFSVEAGTWIIKLGATLSGLFLLSAILAGVFYKGPRHG